MHEFTVSNELLHRPEALRARAQEEGYLFFRSLIDAEAIWRARLQILDLCREAGWLQPGSNPADGIAAEGVAYVEPEPAFMEVYNRLQKLEDFHTLAHQPKLLAMFDTLFGEPTLVHARNIARIIFPQNLKYTTPAHQDYVHIQGTEETWTAWIPLGDCPRELGSLAILRGSHRQGGYPTQAAYGAGGLGIDTESLPYPWVEGDFLIGDVVVFHSLCVHRAIPNLTPNRLRLSVDYRYQPLSHPVVESSFRPHHGQITWEEVYAGWHSNRYQYYWRNLPLRFAEWTPKYHQAARR
ncbi:MAG TPA: phytanoyl-CoA dioxygenase family protein [Chthonomonadales bacterium]|nr:phytanoyl-CoA dioxygenase family protein [Chthonomonadales bacterium]